MGDPRVSIALCTHNGARFLPAQLRSILHQVRLPDELIICDDHSSDATLAIVEEFSRSAPFSVKVRKNPANLGIAKNHEQAINLCKGGLIILCDQDDVWHPEKIVVLERAFTEAPPPTVPWSFLMRGSSIKPGFSPGAIFGKTTDSQAPCGPGLTRATCSMFFWRAPG